MISATTQIIIGLTVGLIATILSSFGVALQRKSYIQLNAELETASTASTISTSTDSKFSKFITKNLWYVGFTVYLTSSLTGSIFSIGALPVTLLAPIGAFSLICNAFFAHYLLHDPWSWQSAIGTLIILIGAVIVGLFGVITEHSRSLEDLMILYQRPAFIVYFTIQEVIIIVCLIWNFFNERRLKSAVHNLGRGGSSSLPFPTLNEDSNRTIVGLIYGTMSILISTQGILFAKSGIELLTLTILGSNQFNRPLAWVIVGLLIITALLQLYYLNRSLEFCDIVLLMPVNYCVYNVSCLLNGLVYYDQWSELPWWKLLLVVVGTIILSLGVVLLSMRPKSEVEDLASIPLHNPTEEDCEFSSLVGGESTPPKSGPHELAQKLDELNHINASVFATANDSLDERSPLLISTEGNVSSTKVGSIRSVKSTNSFKESIKMSLALAPVPGNELEIDNS